MTSQWRKANADEQKRGFVAICMVMEMARKYDEKGRYTGVYQSYLRPYFYTAAMLERRAARGGDLPDWLAQPLQKMQPLHDLDAEWLDYLAGAEPSERVLKKLKSLGSYEVQRLESVA